MKLEKAKGTKDYPPENEIARQHVISVIRETFELYGFSPLETSILERQETLAAKFAGGEEILKEVYKLKDQGNRELGLRYDLTVPLARFMGMHPDIRMPFKRYEIGRVFRDGPIKLGRLREFLQCDADIIGVNGISGEIEVLSCARDAFKKLGIEIETRLNSRKLLSEIMAACEIGNTEEAILAIDKIEKLGMDYVLKELNSKGISESKSKKLISMIVQKGNNKQTIEAIEKQLGKGSEGMKEIKGLLSELGKAGCEVIFQPSLARGLSYYTGAIYEVYPVQGSVKSSLAAGGRWDNLVSRLLVSKRDYPALGISFGIEPITEVLNEKRPSGIKSPAQIYVIPIGDVDGIKVVQELRKGGVKADIDIMQRGPSKNIDYAGSLGIPLVGFYGEDEMKKGVIKIRNLNTGKESLVKIKEAARSIGKDL
ncbi:histidine--tRNA ligase [Candidatus Woesearchaeota archaeon]|nr:histidine--tRNA ligase [Candidatus Woesearchaeota archaeon]